MFTLLFGIVRESIAPLNYYFWQIFWQVLLVWLRKKPCVGKTLELLWKTLLWRALTFQQHQLVCRSTVSYIKELTEPRNPFRKIRLHYDASLQMLDRRLKSWIAYHHISIALTTIRKLQSLEKTACFSSHIVRFIVRPCDDQGKGPVNSFQIVKIVAADLSDQTGLRPSWIEGMHLLDSMRRHTSCARMRDMFLVLTGAVIECPPLDIQILPVETVRREDIPFVPESICLVEATDGI